MREIIITQNDAGQRLDRFLAKAFGLTNGQIHRALREKRVRLNNIHAKDAAVMLGYGDVLKLFMNDNQLQEKPRGQLKESAAIAQVLPDIIYEDNHILILDKPAGLLVYDDTETNTLINAVQTYLESGFAADKTFAPALCHRLDRNTSGLIIAAKTAEALRIISAKIKSREIKKTYLCAVSGSFPPGRQSGVLTAYLKKYPDENRVVISDNPQKDFLTIKTGYRVLDCDFRGEKSLLEIDLITGRTHQIRAHMAHIHHAVLGDGKYGDYKGDRAYKTQALCAWKLRFDFAAEDDDITRTLAGKTFVLEKLPYFAETDNNKKIILKI